MTAKKKLGRYKILGELGRGAMGVVYKAEDPALDRIVALKTIILSDDADGRKDYHKRFFVEAKASARLTHPQIITVYDFGEEDDLAYMAMEFLKGTELRTRMAKGAISVPEAVHIAEQVAEGLGYAHEHGVVHRDIKPSNIMLLPHEQVKIMDFGIARMRTSDHKTSTGLVLGTPKYMSPEQVTGAAIDHRSDIFSLGVVLYEMLTRSRLFSGEDTPQIFYNVVNVQPAPPSRLNPEVPPMLDFVLERALKKDPAVGSHQDAQAGSQHRERHAPPARRRDRGRHASSRVAQVRRFRGDEPAEVPCQAGPGAPHPAAPAGRPPAPRQKRPGAALAVRRRRRGGRRRRRDRFRLTIDLYKTS